jgi:hypothetical protein
VTTPGTNEDDTLLGTEETDVIEAFAGDATVRGDGDVGGESGGDQDFICLGSGDDTADGAFETDKIMGGAGDDIIGGDNFPTVTTTGGETPAFRDFLYGENGNDTFTGGTGDDVIRGGKGNDIVDPDPLIPQGSLPPDPTTPNAGRDNIKTHSGDDTIFEQDGFRDTIDCGEGFESEGDTVFADENDKLSNCENVNPGTKS